MSTGTAERKRDRQKARRAERLQAQAAQERREGARRRVFLVLATVVGIALDGGLGHLLVQGADDTLGVAVATTPADTPPLVTATGGGAQDAAVGVTAPVVQGQTFDGEAVTIGGEGRAQAVVFVAHWCPHCQEELPLIAGWVEDGLLPADVELVGVSTFHDMARPNWPPDEWFADAGFPGLTLVDATDVAATAWGLSGTPMWVFTDDNGTVVARYSGQIDAEQFAEGAALAAGGTAT